MICLNPFWRNSRTEKHFASGANPITDPLNTDPASIRRDPQPAHLNQGVVCGACGCRLAADGAPLSGSEHHKKFLNFEIEMEKKDREISRLQSELAEKTRELTEARAASQSGGGASRSGRSIGSKIG